MIFGLPTSESILAFIFISTLERCRVMIVLSCVTCIYDDVLLDYANAKVQDKNKKVDH
jgi:hypothetical protein